MMAFLRSPFSDRRTFLIIGGGVAPCFVLLALGVWVIRQERELAAKRVADDHARIAAFAGQQLSSRLETVILRAGTGDVKPGDQEIALLASVESGALRFPWQTGGLSGSRAPDSVTARAEATLLSRTNTEFLTFSTPPGVPPARLRQVRP